MISDGSKNKRLSQKRFSEADVWRAIGSGWHPLWTGFRKNGFSVEWHDFKSASPVDCAGSFHPDSVEICLNLDGQAEFSVAETRQTLSSSAALFYFSGRQPIIARRL